MAEHIKIKVSTIRDTESADYFDLNGLEDEDEIEVEELYAYYHDLIGFDSLSSESKIHVLKDALKKSAEETIMWQESFNRAQDELEAYDEKKRLKVLIEPPQEFLRQYGIYNTK